MLCVVIGIIIIKMRQLSGRLKGTLNSGQLMQDGKKVFAS